MTTIREMIDDGIVEPGERTSIIKPYVMSHGTLESRSLYESRKFYEEFLGLECVVHSPTSMGVRCGLKFHIVAVEVGDNIRPVSILTHWGLDVGSKEELERAYEDTQKSKEKYKIRQIKDMVERHGVYGFYFEDLDYNWWEIQYYPGFLDEDMFDFGDRYELKQVTA